MNELTSFQGLKLGKRVARVSWIVTRSLSEGVPLCEAVPFRVRESFRAALKEGKF